VLLTSRVPLHLRVEHDYVVAPLALPKPGDQSPPEQVTQYAAVALFVERASAARSDFVVTAANTPAIAEICARLDGLPLAIELAAVRVRLLSPEVLLSRLSSQLQLLTGGARDLEARQQTMRATIAWSVALLHPQEQVLFRRLSVFVGGGTLEAIEAVSLAPEGAEPLEVDLLDGLGALVDQSLLQRREEEDGELRFGMLHVIREFAQEQLVASGEGEALQHAHAAYYLTLVEQLDQESAESDQVKLFARLEREHDNLQGALNWWLESGSAEMAGRFCLALENFWTMAGHWIEQEQWLVRTLYLGDALPPGQSARLLRIAAYVARMQGQYGKATRNLEQSLDLFRGMGDRAGMGATLGQLAFLALAQERFKEAEQQFGESLRLLQEVDDRASMLTIQRLQADLPLIRGHLQETKLLLDQALALAESLGDIHDIADCKARLGWLALLNGHDAEAETLLDQALAIQQQLNDTNCSAWSLACLGIVALERADVARAQAQLEQSLSLYAKIARRERIAETQFWLGQSWSTAGQILEAEAAYLEGLRLERELGSKRRTAASLEGLAGVALSRGNPERTARLLGAAAQALHSVGAAPLPLPPRLRAQREHVAAQARHSLGEASWEAAFAGGESLSLDEALAEALSHGSSVIRE
jgi:predicted ATPase